MSKLNRKSSNGFREEVPTNADDKHGDNKDYKILVTLSTDLNDTHARQLGIASHKPIPD